MKRKNVIYTFKKRETCFFTLLKCLDNSFRIYGSQYHKFGRTICINSYDGITWKDKLNIVLTDTCASHNFYPFVYENKYFAIGGLDSWKQNKEWQNPELNFKQFKVMFKNQFGREYDRDEKRFLKFKERIGQEPVYNHNDGLYLFNSDDGIEWKTEKRIITSKHKGFNSAISWGKASEFDGHISCIHFKENEILYIRNNIKQGIRGIQYAASINGFDNFVRFYPLKLKGENYYTANFMNYKMRIIGLLPYFDKKRCCIKLVVSENGVDFVEKRELFVDKPAVLRGKLKNKLHFVNGFINKNGMLNFFVHENYFGADKNKPVQLVRYEILEKEFDKWLNLN